jgi:elongation factor Ts
MHFRMLLASKCRLSISNLKLLRDLTGSPISSCKDAIVECLGDVEKAAVLLRKRGLETSMKYGARSTLDGAFGVSIYQSQMTTAIAVELGCETDFVSRSSEFQALVENIPLTIEGEPRGIEDLQQNFFKTIIHPHIPQTRVGDAIAGLSSLVGEKIEIRRIEYIKADFVSVFVHPSSQGTVGKAVGLVGFDLSEEIRSPEIKSMLKPLAHLVARHVVGSRPRYLRRSECEDGELSADDVLEESSLILEKSAPRPVSEILARFIQSCKLPKDSVVISSFKSLWI